MAYDIPLITPRDGHGKQNTYPSAVGAPGPFVVNGDQIQLSATTSNSTGALEITYRLLTPGGEVVNGQMSMTFSGTGTQTAVRTALTTGWLIGFDVHRTSGTLLQGEVFASVHVVQNAGSSWQAMLCLASGSVTDIKSLGLGAFTDLYVPATEAAFEYVTASSPDPAPGDPATYTLPANYVYKIVEIYADFSASAAVANRYPLVKVHLPGGASVDSYTAQAIAANEYWSVYFVASTSTPYDIPTVTIGPWNGALEFPAGTIISVSAINMDAADQLLYLTIILLRQPV